MPRSAKVVRHKSVHFVTTTTESGLPLVANQLMKLIIQSCIAHAQRQYPVKIIAFVVESSHVHIILRVYNPDDLTRIIHQRRWENKVFPSTLSNYPCYQQLRKITDCQTSVSPVAELNIGESGKKNPQQYLDIAGNF